jgi:Na+-transporting NADH:ubiquinone oxidoreductase subunit NqrF
MIKSGKVRFRGFYDKKTENAMMMNIKKVYLRKDGVNKWYCYLELTPFRELENKILFMRLSKRVQLIFRKGYYITIDVDTFMVENSTIIIEGYINKKFTTWKHVLFDRVRKNESVEDDCDDEGDLNECCEEEDDKYDGIYL